MGAQEEQLGAAGVWVSRPELLTGVTQKVLDWHSSAVLARDGQDR